MSKKSDFASTAPLSNLRFRARLLRRLREFFDRHDFLEVETPLLSADTVVDRHLDPVPVTLFNDPRSPEVGQSMWLQTSPEFAMKRLLASGADAIYQVAKAFRGGEVGTLHNPEFTMVEWYRTGDSMEDGIDLLSDLVHALLDCGPADVVTYEEAFSTCIGCSPHVAANEELIAAAHGRGLAVPESLDRNDRDSWLELLFVECVQPKLGLQNPVIVFDYPVGQAALARVRPGDPPVAERFELFVQGIEIANGYHELLEADELLRRAAAANQQRMADGKPALPTANRLLAAMQAGLPPCAGVALGLDRLAMVALGASNIAEVIAFPIGNA